MIDPTRVYRARQICQETGCPRSMVYAALASGELKAVRRGRTFLCAGSAVLAWLERLGQ